MDGVKITNIPSSTVIQYTITEMLAIRDSMDFTHYVKPEYNLTKFIEVNTPLNYISK